MRFWYLEAFMLQKWAENGGIGFLLDAIFSLEMAQKLPIRLIASKAPSE